MNAGGHPEGVFLRPGRFCGARLLREGPQPPRLAYSPIASPPMYHAATRKNTFSRTVSAQ